MASTPAASFKGKDMSEQNITIPIHAVIYKDPSDPDYSIEEFGIDGVSDELNQKIYELIGVENLRKIIDKQGES